MKRFFQILAIMVTSLSAFMIYDASLTENVLKTGLEKISKEKMCNPSSTALKVLAPKLEYYRQQTHLGGVFASSLSHDVIFSKGYCRNCSKSEKRYKWWMLSYRTLWFVKPSKQVRLFLQYSDLLRRFESLCNVIETSKNKDTLDSAGTLLIGLNYAGSLISLSHENWKRKLNTGFLFEKHFAELDKKVRRRKLESTLKLLQLFLQKETKKTLNKTEKIAKLISVLQTHFSKAWKL